MKNAIATSHPLAVQAGHEIYAQGGNAVDAAIAAAAVLTVVEPGHCGLGSDAHAQVWDGRRLHALDASGTAPAAWSPNYFVGKYGDQEHVPQRGIDSVTVPGAVAAWSALSARFGKLNFADLIKPAVVIAEQGWVVNTPWNIQPYWQQPGFVDVFSRGGRLPKAGGTWQASAMAQGLRQIADTHGQAFYQGEIAGALVQFNQRHGGAMTAEDLAQYQPQWVNTISQTYCGYSVHELPPRGQGIAALMALGMLEHFDLQHNAHSVHVQIEAMKLAFADLYHFIARPGSVTEHQLLDPDYLRRRAGLISLDQAQNFGAGTPPSGDTVAVTTADSTGIMVSFMQSNYQGFGSGCVEPTFGISLQNRGHAFRVQDVVPGARPFHTCMPGMVMKNGQPVLSFGIVGGNMQPQAHVQTLVRVLKYQHTPQLACTAPRWRWDQAQEIAVEPGIDTGDLVRRGHVINNSNSNFGVGQFVWRGDDFSTMSDTRTL